MEGGCWFIGFLRRRLPRGCPAKEFVCTAVFTQKLLAQLTTGEKKRERDSLYVYTVQPLFKFIKTSSAKCYIVLVAQHQSLSIKVYLRKALCSIITPLSHMVYSSWSTSARSKLTPVHDEYATFSHHTSFRKKKFFSSLVIGV